MDFNDFNDSLEKNYLFFELDLKKLGIGDWAQSPIPNPQSPIPNPHSFK